MEGDICDLPAIVQVCKKYKAYLYVDEYDDNILYFILHMFIDIYTIPHTCTCILFVSIYVSINRTNKFIL